MRRLLKDRHAILIIMSVAVGALAGLANIGFRSALHFVHDFLFVKGSVFLHMDRGGIFLLLLPVLPMVGAALLIPFSLKFPGEVNGYGFYNFIENVNMKGGVFKPRAILLKIIGPALTIGSGGSAGVEGPIATVGGTIGSVVGQIFKVSGTRMKLLVAAGSAGAIAATFNAPIAGVMFAMEIVLLGNYELTSFAAIVISSGIATVISRAYYGASPAFTVPSYNLVSPYEIPLYMLLGIIVAVLSVLYIRVFYGVKDRFTSLKVYPQLKPIIGAFIVGSVGIFLPQILSDGYDIIEQAMAGDIALKIIVLLVFFKILATSITLGSGGAGGVFAPALFIGAMIGGSFGIVVHKLLPGVTASAGAYATVGIGAFLAAATHAPLTAIFLMFEMTANYQIIVPVMFAAIIGTLLARRMLPDSIDTFELSRRGVDIHAGREVSIMSRIPVRNVMLRDVDTVRYDTPLNSIINLMIQKHRFYLPVVDDEELMMGIVSIQDVRPVMFDEYIKGIVRAGELATENVVILKPSDDLNTATELFSIKDLEEIPVVSPDNPRQVVGILRRRDVMEAYNREVLKQDRSEAF